MFQLKRLHSTQVKKAVPDMHQEFKKAARYIRDCKFKALATDPAREHMLQRQRRTLNSLNDERLELNMTWDEFAAHKGIVTL